MTNRLLARAQELRTAERLAPRPAKCQVPVAWKGHPTFRRQCRRYAVWILDGEPLCRYHAAQRLRAAPIQAAALVPP